MRRFITKCILYFSVSFIVLNGLALLLDIQICNSNIFKVNVILKTDHLPPNIILGSSRALTGIDTKLLCDLTGRKWYNMSIDDTPIEIHLLIYQLLVESGKAPDILLLQYDREGTKAIRAIHEKDYQFMPFSLYESKVIKEYLVEKEKGYGYTYLPIMKYTTFNTELVFSFLRLISNNDYRHRFDENGDYSYPQNFSYRSKCTENEEISPDFSDPTLMTLTSLCEKNGTKLIVFTAPYRCRELLAKQTIPALYLDYTSSLKSDSCFYDDQHLNPIGREKFTEKVGSDLNTFINDL